MGKKNPVVITGALEADLPKEKIYTGVSFQINADYKDGKPGQVLGCNKKHKGRTLPITLHVRGLPNDINGLMCNQYLTYPNKITHLDITMELQTGYLSGFGTSSCWKNDPE